MTAKTTGKPAKSLKTLRKVSTIKRLKAEQHYHAILKTIADLERSKLALQGDHFPDTVGDTCTGADVLTTAAFLSAQKKRALAIDGEIQKHQQALARCKKTFKNALGADLHLSRAHPPRG